MHNSSHTITLRILIIILLIGLTDSGYAEKNQAATKLSEVPVSGEICGQAALKVALCLQGANVTLEEILKIVPERDSGSSISELCKASKKLGFAGVPFRSPVNGIPWSQGLPIVRIKKTVKGHQFLHYVVLVKHISGQFLALDPYEVPTVYDEKHFSEIYVGDGLSVSIDAVSNPIRLTPTNTAVTLALAYVLAFLLNYVPKKRTVKAS